MALLVSKVLKASHLLVRSNKWKSEIFIIMYISVFSPEIFLRIGGGGGGGGGGGKDRRVGADCKTKTEQGRKEREISLPT